MRCEEFEKFVGSFEIKKMDWFNSETDEILRELKGTRLKYQRLYYNLNGQVDKKFFSTEKFMILKEEYTRFILELDNIIKKYEFFNEK